MYPAVTEDVTGIQDTEGSHFKHLKAAILSFEEAHVGVDVISYTSGATANSRKDSRLHAEWRPELILLDCMAQMVPPPTCCPRSTAYLHYCCRLLLNIKYWIDT